MKSYGTLVGELPTGIEFVVEGALLRIYEDGKCGTGVEVGAPGEGSGEGGNHGAPTN